MASIFQKIKEENQQGVSIFQQKEPVGISIFSNIETIPPETTKTVQPQEDLSKSSIAQFMAGVRRFGVPLTQGLGIPEQLKLKGNENIPWEQIDQLSTPQGLPTKISRGAGSLVGLLPYFMGGGVGGKIVGGGVTKALASKLPTLAKYIGASAGGVTTFTGARALRNVVEKQPITQGLPEEAAMGSIFGPTGLIHSYPKAIATSFGLGSLIAPKGEKLSTGILFGGLTALTHQRPDLSVQDKTNIDTLYKEATFKEGIREVKQGLAQAKIPISTQRQLPVPETLYGEGFTAKPSVTKIPLSIQKQLGFRQPEQIGYEPLLEKGVTRTGEGFTVTGGKQIARPLGKGVAKELRTTPTPEETIQKVAQQSPTVVEKVKQPLPTGEGKFNAEIKVATQKIMRPGETIGENVARTKDWIASVLDNDEVSTNAELVNYFQKEGGFSKDVAEYIVSKRKIVRELPYGVKKEMKEPTGEVITNISEPTISKKIGLVKPTGKIKFGEVPYTQRGGVITGPKKERLLLPEEKFELQNKLSDAITQAPEQGTYAKPVKIQVGNWELKLENDKEKLTNFNNIINKRGSIVVPPELTEPITQTATKIYRGIAPAGEVLRNDKLINSVMAERQRKIAETQGGELPQSMVAQRLKEINDSEKVIEAINKSGSKDESILITRAADAIDKERAFVNKYTKILDLADKVGITEGSKASETIFKALDYRRASPEEIAKLTPDQQKFIPIIRNAYKEIWGASGKSEYEGIRDYATHLINDGLEKGYDVSPLGRFLPDELYSRFFETRKGAKPYKQDIVKALDIYIPSVSRKIFREPVLQEYNTLLDPYLNLEYKNEAVDFMEAFLGRGRYKGEEVLGRLPKDLVRLTYRGTLYANFSAATKNATQVLTNTIPEIGPKSVMYGYRRLMSSEGRQEFIDSGLSGDFSLGKPIDQLDFFSQVEFVNRGVTYLGAKQKALSEGRGLIEAERYATKIVRKTQFIQTGIDVPKLYRQYGSVGRILGQFTQFPTKQGFLLYNWARNGQWGKVARFATIAYLLGGTRTVPFLDGIIDGDYKQLPQMPEDTKKLIKNVERYTSLAGLSGIDIGQNFGLGIYSSGVPFARGPAASLIGAEIPRFVKAIATHEITNLQDIIRSRLVQKSLPTLVPGGFAMKKIIDLINTDENDYKIRNAYNQLQYTSSPKEEILRILVGPTKERKEAWQSLSKERQEAEIYRNEHRKMLDYVLDSKGDSMALEEFLKKYPNYDRSNLVDELMERAKKRELPANVREYLTRPKALR